MSFRLKTILGIAAIELALLSLLLWSGLRFMAGSTETEFRQRTEATSRAYAVAARDALISNDLAVLKALTDEMMRYPGVVYARVRDNTGRTLAEAGDAQALARPAPPASAPIEALPGGVFDTQAPIAEAGTPFGRIELGITATDLVSRLAEARRFGIALAGAEILLVGLFSWLLGAYLTRQLADLSTGARRIAAGELGVQVPVRSRDDLGHTAEAFNTMSHSLADSYAAVAEREQELARRSAYLTQVLDTTHDGIIVIDEHGIVESFNGGARQMFGWTAEEIIGGNVSRIVPQPHQAVHDDYVRRFVTTGESHVLGQEREFEARRKDGSPMWIALRIAELPVPGQRRFIGVVHDITQRKQAELELRQAKRAAEDAAAAKSEFLANMSHEIRTPMHGMLGSIEMLRETPLSMQQQRHLETAATSGNVLLGVIDEILDFSRLEAGKLRIESIEFDLRNTVEDVTVMLRHRAHDKRLELACYIAPEVPAVVRGDPIRLRQILVNLVGNAIKFTESGEVVVTVLLEDSADGLVLRLEVRDTGIGIPEDKQASLFEPFTQADSSTSRRFGGSGLGLSIARRLVALMNGQIGFRSRRGEGSTFWFTVPVQAPASGAGMVHQPANFKGTRVLVVDDHPTNRIILHRYLTAWGSQSGSATGGDEALAKLQDAAIAGQPYHLALLDLNMPGMDGYTLVERIQADPALAEMPLIMLSSSVQDASRMAGLRVDVWLDKPVRQSDLHDAIATVLTRTQVGPASAAPGGAGASALHFAGEKVLLVEDYPVTAELGLQMLRRRGLQADLATNGQAAVEAVKSGNYDIVLMDIQMPTMDGYQATAAIRSWEREARRTRIPVIALTAHALPADRARCLAAEMDDFVSKPFSGDALASVIARWLPPPGQAPAQASAPTLDQARLAEVRAAMGRSMPELMAKVREALDGQAAALEAAQARGDALACTDALHRIKNIAGDVGAHRLIARAAELEAAAAGAPAQPPVGLPWDDLRVEIEAARLALDNWMAREKLS